MVLSQKPIIYHMTSTQVSISVPIVERCVKNSSGKTTLPKPRRCLLLHPSKVHGTSSLLILSSTLFFHCPSQYGISYVTLDHTIEAGTNLQDYEFAMNRPTYYPPPASATTDRVNSTGLFTRWPSSGWAGKRRRPQCSRLLYHTTVTSL